VTPSTPAGSAHDYVALLGLTTFDLPGLLRLVEGGLPTQAFDAFVASTDLGEARAAELVDISARVLATRRREGRLSCDESDRLVRAARLFADTLALFKGDRTTAAAWLQSGQPTLGGATPLHLARTELGAREVERALTGLRTRSKS
jgi:putative toxin-antitoxin system antitoxin component (TIGR02293 family)